MFLVSDDFGDFKEIMDYKQLKNMLIDEIVRDTKESTDSFDKDIICNNADMLSKLAKEDFTSLEYINDELSAFGWYVQDLSNLQRDLNNLNEYLHRTDTKVKEELKENINKIDSIINLIGELR